MHTNLNYNNLSNGSNNNNNNNNNSSTNQKSVKHAFAQNGIYHQRKDEAKPFTTLWTHMQSAANAVADASIRSTARNLDLGRAYFQPSSFPTAANAAEEAAVSTKHYNNDFYNSLSQCNEVGEPHIGSSSQSMSKQQQQLMSNYYQQQRNNWQTNRARLNVHNQLAEVHIVERSQNREHDRHQQHKQQQNQHHSNRSQPQQAMLQRQQAAAAAAAAAAATACEPTWDRILSENPTTHITSNEHYEHYFSYFYNRNPENKPRVHTPRRLPMNIPVNSLRNVQHEDVITASSLDSSHRQHKTSPIAAATAGDYPSPGHYQSSQNHHSKTNTHHILQEKLPNNNIVNGYDNGEWLHDDFLDEHVGYNGKGDAHDRGEQHTPRTKRQYRRRSECELPAAPVSPLHIVEVSGNGTTQYNNNYVLKSNKVREHAQTQSRLPLTPKRIKGGTIQKKAMPSVHRVLLYNNQSPRVIRKPRNKANESSSQQVITLKPPEAKVSTDDKTSIGSDNDDYDEDDDLDNVSNFGDSDISSIGSEDEDGYRAYAFKLTHSLDRLSATQSFLSSQSSEESLKSPESLLAPSLFPNVPPYLSFSSNTQKGPPVPAELHRVLKWRVTNIMPKVVRLILANSGMRLLKKTNDWMGVWGKHLKSPCFKTIRSYQKINHLPGSFRIGRKDSCWKNLQKHMVKYSKREFGFMPRTYIIPHDLNILRKHWPKYAQRNTKWIIKPPASARGAGIRVVNRWAQIPKRRPLIVQKYIERPLLINGSKFDLRLYVLVTSINPLRVYMYHNGLARFASVKYSAKVDTLNDRCMHLTNYSINKFSSNYSKNEDVNACHGHKWTIKSLWTYLANRGVRTDYLWEALRSLVLRTILAGENSINNMIKMNVESKYSVFELFGFDVILDADLVPWLLEVNISPSLHSELPLDAHVKAPLVQGVLNTALYNVPPKLTVEKQKEIAAEFSLPVGTQLCYDKRLYINYLSREEKIKHNTFCRKSMEEREDYLNGILNKLTPDDVRCLIIAEDELARCAPLERIFPTDQTHKYLKYTETPRYYNRLLDAWESRYAHNRNEGIALLRQYCRERYHLQVPSPPAKKYIEGDHTSTYSLHLPPEQDIPMSSPGLLHQIYEMDFKVIIAAIVFVMVTSLALSAISLILINSMNNKIQASNVSGDETNRSHAVHVALETAMED